MVKFCINIIVSSKRTPRSTPKTMFIVSRLHMWIARILLNVDVYYIHMGGMEKKNIQSISSETASFLVGQKMKEAVRQPISRDLLKIRSSSHDDIQTMWFARSTTRHFPLKHMPHAFPLKLLFFP